jgi:hypothetical protein
MIQMMRGYAGVCARDQDKDNVLSSMYRGRDDDYVSPWLNDADDAGCIDV